MLVLKTFKDAKFVVDGNAFQTFITLCKDVTTPIHILALYMQNIIADTNRQSNMHIIACGIICHQNWRIGPSLEADRVYSYGSKVKCNNETILVNIVEFIHS